MEREHRPGPDGDEQPASVETPPLPPRSRRDERNRDDHEGESQPPDGDRERMRVREAH
jgi:hypothetical protein